MAKPSFSVFFSHPMRPFFISAALFGVMGALSFFVAHDYILMHKSLLLGILPAFAYGGFLLTAVPDWTGYRGSLKRVATLFYALIGCAAVLLFFHQQSAQIVLTVFWLLLLVFCSYLLWLDRNDDNFALLMILALFVVLQGFYAYGLSAKYLRLQIHLNIVAIVFISFRVSVMMGAEALKSTNLKDPVFIPNKVYRNLVMTFILLYIGSELVLESKVGGFIALGAGFVLLAKLKELHHTELLRKAYLAVYYVMQLLGGLGYLWLGYLQINDEYGTEPMHLIAIAYLMGTIFFILMIAGIRHSGFQSLIIPRGSLAALVCLFASALCRALLAEQSAGLYLHLPATLLLCASLAYLKDYLNIFARNRFSDDPE